MKCTAIGAGQDFQSGSHPGAGAGQQSPADKVREVMEPQEQGGKPDSDRQGKAPYQCPAVIGHLPEKQVSRNGPVETGKNIESGAQLDNQGFRAAENPAALEPGAF